MPFVAALCHRDKHTQSSLAPSEQEKCLCSDVSLLLAADRGVAELVAVLVCHCNAVQYFPGRERKKTFGVKMRSNRRAT